MPPSAIREEPRYNGLDSTTTNQQQQQQQQDLMTDTNDVNCSQKRTAGSSQDNDLVTDYDLAEPHIHDTQGFEPNPPPRAGAPTSVEDSARALLVQETTVPKSILVEDQSSHHGDFGLRDMSRSGSQEPVDHDNHPGTPTDQTSNHDNQNNRNRYRRSASTRSTTSSPIRMVNKLNNIVTRISKVFANSSSSSSVINPIDKSIHQDNQSTSSAFGNRRALEKTWKLMDKVVKCCQDSRMNLNNSPPFILDILPETYRHLKLTHTKHDLQQPQQVQINDNEYSRVFLKNLQSRCEQTLKLFKDAKVEIYNEDSEQRHKLTRNTLVFNHMLSELKAIFPNGTFIGDKYLITKKESAGEFWKSYFGTGIMVNWKTFYHALQQVHSIDSSFFSLNALKQTIDLTCDDHISIFEFDVFTRLFQPWSTLLKNWQTLAVTHPGYKAFLTYDELKARLQKHIDKPGSYVFRLSCTRLGQWAIGYVTQDGQILQTIVQNISLSQALTETEFYVFPDGKEEDPELRERLRSGMTGDDERNVIVTEEQYNIYCSIGNSFQTCKICFVNDKEIRIEPCNHLLCTSCLLAWQESEGQGCPYCRTEIKETVQITMDLRSAKFATSTSS